MKFILVAKDSYVFFFPLWMVLAFGLTITIILYMLYPQDLLKKVLAQNEPSAVTLSYLKAFRKNNEHNLPFMVALIEQEIGMNQLNQAQKDINFLKKKWGMSIPENNSEIQWLDYLMLKNKAFKAKINTPIRITYLLQLRSMANTLLNAPLTANQSKLLAEDMLALGKPQFSLTIYKRLLANKELTTVADLSHGGSIAMQNNAHRDSSEFYWAAYTIAAIEDKKQYALAAIKALWAGNFVKEAVALANQLPTYLIHDRSTLIYLSELALAANQPKIAEKYMLEALSLK